MTLKKLRRSDPIRVEMGGILNSLIWTSAYRVKSSKKSGVFKVPCLFYEKVFGLLIPFDTERIFVSLIKCRRYELYCNPGCNPRKECTQPSKCRRHDPYKTPT